MTDFVVLMDILSADFANKLIDIEIYDNAFEYFFEQVFCRFARIFIKSEHPLLVPQKNEHPTLRIKNTIRMIFHKNLTHMMMLSRKLQCTTMRKITWQGSVIIVPCWISGCPNHWIQCFLNYWELYKTESLSTFEVDFTIFKLFSTYWDKQWVNNKISI